MSRQRGASTADKVVLNIGAGLMAVGVILAVVTAGAGFLGLAFIGLVLFLIALGGILVGTKPDAQAAVQPVAQPAVATPPPPPQIPAAWYPNPEGPGQRYWDGAGWTTHTAP